MKKTGFIGSMVHHVTREETTVALCLGTHFHLSPPQIEELFNLGAIYLDKRRVLEDRKLVKGAYLRVHMKPKRFSVMGIDWKGSIIHETKQFLVVKKPAGIPVHASLDNIRENVLQQMRDVTGKDLYVTQRLDVPVAGLLVFGKTPEFQRNFNRWLAEHRIEKRYRALVDKTVSVGDHTHFMEPSERSPKRVVLAEKPGWLKCELTVHRCEPKDAYFDVEIELLTGRTHQIRAQLSAAGAPILGDKMYGSREVFPSGIALFSSEVAWETFRFKLLPPWLT